MTNWIGKLLKRVRENPRIWPVGRRPILAEPLIIADALSKLLDTKNGAAYTIIDGCGLDRFVQFALGEQGQLELDLPTLQMNDLERVRAQEFFEKLGVKSKHTFQGKNVYKLDLGQDCDYAAELAIRIFTELFGAKPDFMIQVSAG